jgi:hypothetical protein
MESLYRVEVTFLCDGEYCKYIYQDGLSQLGATILKKQFDRLKDSTTECRVWKKG